MKTSLSCLLLALSALGWAEGATFLGNYETNQVSLTAGFIPDATRIIIGEPLFLTFVLSNRADHPFHFSHVRTEIFHLTATSTAGAPAREFHNHMMDGNGFNTDVGVLPGQVHIQRLFNDWCAFEQPGENTMTCQGKFWWFSNPTNALHHPIATTFKLTVLPSDPKRLTEIIAAWGRTVETNGSWEESAQALASINDPRTIPHLAALVAKNPGCMPVQP